LTILDHPRGERMQLLDYCLLLIVRASCSRPLFDVEHCPNAGRYCGIRLPSHPCLDVQSILRPQLQKSRTLHLAPGLACSPTRLGFSDPSPTSWLLGRSVIQDISARNSMSRLHDCSSVTQFLCQSSRWRAWHRFVWVVCCDGQM
jgi:hypothetical protein